MHAITKERTRWRVACLVGVLAIGAGNGVMAAHGIYAAGRGWFATLVVGLLCGVLGVLSAYLFLLGGLQFVGLVRYLLHLRRQK
jgi:hypothetical protein